MKLIVFALILLAGLLVVAQAPKGSATELRALADQYFDQYFFPFNPTAGTASGFHQYDNQLEDYSSAAISRQVKMLQEFKKKFEALDAHRLDRSSATDRQLLLGDIDGRLLEYQSIRQWEHNPDRYSSGISGSIFVIMARNFAPADQRIKSVIARERQIPGVFVAARRNLKDVPQLYVDIAIEQIPGIIGFFEKDVPEAFKDVKDPKLLAEFRSVNAKVLDLLKQYQEFLTKEITGVVEPIGTYNRPCLWRHRDIAKSPVTPFVIGRSDGFFTIWRSQSLFWVIFSPHGPVRKRSFSWISCSAFFFWPFSRI